MDNTRVEQIVAKKDDATSMIVRVVAVVLAVFSAFISIGLLGAFGFVIIFFVVYLVIYVIKISSIEFEYILVNNELTIDAIYGKEKRKSLISFDVREAEIFAPIESDRVHNHLHNQSNIVKNFSSGEDNAKVYLLVVNSNSHMYNVFLEPNDKLFEGIKYYIPRKTYTE